MNTPAEVLRTEGERLLWAFARSVVDYALLAMDTDGRIVGCNEGAQVTFGYSAEELHGQTLELLLSAEDRAAGVQQRELRDALGLGRALDERWHLRKDRSRFWALGITVPIRASDGTLQGFGKIFRDSSDLKQLQDTLQQRAAQLAAANEDKNVFIATLAHELRSPLSALKQAGLLVQGAPELDRERVAQIIARQVEYTQRLIEDVLDLTRVGRGKLQLQLTPLDVREVVRRSVETVRAEAQRRGIPVRLSEESTAMPVRADAPRLLQVFVNLLNNAVKFSPAGAAVDVALDSDGDQAIVRVRDRGAGIEGDQLESIFELFSQAQNTPGGREAGLGIGLALCRDLVRLHGGTIQARSEGRGQGSEFTVRLPLCAPAGSQGT